jgi:beta-glucanase (GH16 family)
MYRILRTLFLIFLPISVFTQSIQDDFEGSGTITNWIADNCNMNTSLSNPQQVSINTSSTVLEYHDIGGQYANIGFDAISNFDLSTDATFSLKIYVPSGGLTGSQPNQISLKLQDGTLGSPWTTQSEIIKPILLDQWQTVTFDFLNDAYVNFDAGSPPPTQRTDFNRIILQVNGENNTDHVLAYIDDFLYDVATVPVSNNFNVLVWSDEFDVDGAINSTNWHHQTQLPVGGSWYNGEIQHYTDRVDNSSVNNGNLNLIAKKETFTDQGYTKSHTSARLNSKFAFKYGKVEIRAKLPTGVGTWPAMWMLGKNINEDGGYWDNQGFGNTGWPACGEVDIMEHWGHNQNKVTSATHTPSSFGNTVNYGEQIIATASTDFHVYSLEWTSEKLVFAVDGVIHMTYNPTVKDASTWPFDAEQYILLNIAIEPSIDAAFTQDTMEIDYIRIYQDAPIQSITAAPIPVHDETLNNVISIFSDTYTNVVGTNYDPGWGQTTDATIETINGNTTLKYSDLNYQGTEYTSQDVSTHTHLHLDFWTADATALDFYLISQTPTVDTDLYSLSTLSKNQWISVEIPLTSFPNVDLADVFQFKVVGNGTVYFDNIYFYDNTVVPVELSYFKAEKVENNNILHWETLSELNNSHFEIQRSKNGIDFENIGTVQGKGTSLELKKYNFIDNDPLMNSYYRLNQIDFDGTITYSTILNVEREKIKVSNISFYPMPVRENLIIEFESRVSDRFYLTIRTINGSVVFGKWFNINHGENKLEIDFKDLPKGSYIVQLKSAKKVINHQIIKQ